MLTSLSLSLSLSLHMYMYSTCISSYVGIPIVDALSAYLAEQHVQKGVCAGDLHFRPPAAYWLANCSLQGLMLLHKDM